MKYLPMVILLGCSVFSMSSAMADEATCTQDLYNLGKCAAVDIAKGVVEVKDDMTLPIHEGSLKIKAAAGVAVIDFGGGVVMHLEQAGKDLAQPWKEDFKNMEDEQDQDVAHAVGDAGKAIGQTSEKIGKGIWHGLKSVWSDTGTIVIRDERKGFKDHPNTDEDVVGFVNAEAHGVKNVLVDMKNGTYKLFTKIKGKYVARMILERQKDLNDVLALASKGKVEPVPAENNEMISQVSDKSEAKAIEAPVTEGISRSPAVMTNDFSTRSGSYHSGAIIDEVQE
jgi:hypothetical protein